MGKNMLEISRWKEFFQKILREYFEEETQCPVPTSTKPVFVKHHISTSQKPLYQEFLLLYYPIKCTLSPNISLLNTGDA